MLTSLSSNLQSRVCRYTRSAKLVFPIFTAHSNHKLLFPYYYYSKNFLKKGICQYDFTSTMYKYNSGRNIPITDRPAEILNLSRIKEVGRDVDFWSQVCQATCKTWYAGTLGQQNSCFQFSLLTATINYYSHIIIIVKTSDLPV